MVEARVAAARLKVTDLEHQWVCKDGSEQMDMVMQGQSIYQIVSLACTALKHASGLIMLLPPPT